MAHLPSLRPSPTMARVVPALLLALALVAPAGCGTAAAPQAAGSPSPRWSPPPTPSSSKPTAAPSGSTQLESTNLPTASSPSPTGPTSQSTTDPARLAAPPPHLPAAVGTGWRLVDFDDFSGHQLDESRWRVYTAPATNKVSRWTSDMVSVSDGALRINGEGKSPDGAGNVSGGLCWCGGSGDLTYGIWQVRAKFDAGRGYGQAILLWPTSDRWPADGEIDIVETPYPDKSEAFTTVHWGSDGTDRIDSRHTNGDFTQWHIYTLEWRPDRIRTWIDNRLAYDTATARVRPQIPNNPMHLAIQQEPGPLDDWVPAPDATTPDRVTMSIDWVRVYR